MTESSLQTSNLTLIPQTVEEVRAMVAALEPADRAHVSPDWLALLAGTPDVWTLGFSLVHRGSGLVVGTCGFKGPPTSDGIVEIAYGIDSAHQGQGYATEAAQALVAFAFEHQQVRVVRAHTLPEVNASTRVLTKCDFRHVGQVIDPEDGLVARWEKYKEA